MVRTDRRKSSGAYYSLKTAHRRKQWKVTHNATAAATQGETPAALEIIKKNREKNAKERLYTR